MIPKFSLLLTLGLLMSQFLSAADNGVSHIVRDSKVLIEATDAGRQFDWEVKKEGDTLVICRDELCVPLRLNQTAHVMDENRLYIDAKQLGEAMGFDHKLSDGKLTLTSSARTAASTYHEAWGEGRGFQPGQTLPDIPLIDLEGNEVRFSDFLGKRYVIYGWASW